MHAINGRLDKGHAEAITAPMVARRETARLPLAALPERTATPEAEVIDAEAFRAAVLEAWTDQLPRTIPRLTRRREDHLRLSPTTRRPARLRGQPR